ncbi:MAG: MFS transporter, partial [Chloroflexi bacterium]|nr:MFS transporter [Chloroflexota bacterium]
AGAVEAFDQPARRALFPQLIERKDMMSAVALNSSIWPLTRTMSPAIAGLIIGIAGTAVCFTLAAVGFLIMAAVTFGLRVPPVTRTGNAGVSKELLEGLNFIRKDSTFAFLISMTFFSSFFGNSYQALMPIFAVDILGVEALGLGFLQSAGAVGSVIVTSWLAFGGGAGSKGPLIMGGAVMSGLSIAAFALTSQFVGSFYLAMFLMLAVGVFNTGFTTASQSALQMMVPDHIRGRVMGFYGMTYNIRPLGAMQAGALASVGAIGAPFAVAIGGLAVVAFPVISLLVNKKVRNLSQVLRQAEAARATTGQIQSPAPSAAND